MFHIWQYLQIWTSFLPQICIKFLKDVGDRGDSIISIIGGSLRLDYFLIDQTRLLWGGCKSELTDLPYMAGFHEILNIYSQGNKKINSLFRTGILGNTNSA